jgi:pimeloyl-ACP methyl ester carboxylesterase
MGSNQGKSGIAAASGLAEYDDRVRELHMVDPLFDLSNLEAWANSCQGHPNNAGYGSDRPEFNVAVARRVIDARSGAIVPVLHGDFSLHAIPVLSAQYGKFAYVFIDSDQHQYELCRAECNLLMDRMVEGGLVVFHDFRSQFLGVAQVYQEMIDTHLFVEVPVPWDTIREEVAKIGGEAGNDSWHHTEMDAPCFVGALKFVGEKGLPYFKPGAK